MNDNEKVIVQMILDRLNAGEGLITGLWMCLHVRTQGKVKQLLDIGEKMEVIDLSTDSRKMKAVNAFQELLR